MSSAFGRLGVACLGLALAAGVLGTVVPNASASVEPALFSMDEAISRLSIADTQGGGEGEPVPDDPPPPDDSGSDDSGAEDSGGAEGSQ